MMQDEQIFQPAHIYTPATLDRLLTLKYIHPKSNLSGRIYNRNSNSNRKQNGFIENETAIDFNHNFDGQDSVSKGCTRPPSRISF